jgi:hypothetical protein
VRRYLDEQIEFGRTHGYVETITGRRRYIPEITSSNFNVRAFGERAATNAPIQGSSADLIKIAMIRIHEELKRDSGGARMLLQVHDELLFEVPQSGADALLPACAPTWRTRCSWTCRCGWSRGRERIGWRRSRERGDRVQGTGDSKQKPADPGTVAVPCPLFPVPCRLAIL